MLLHIAIGDAYGAGFEYADPAFVAANNDPKRGYVQHPRHQGVSPGSYTDDTQMAIAVAEALLSRDPWTESNLAERFVEVFRRDPREGYSRGLYALLQQVHDGSELLARINPRSDRSGAAMRVGPVGLLPTVSDVLDHAEIQARVTHDTPAGIESAQAAALMFHYCHFNIGPAGDVGLWVEEQLRQQGGRGSWSRPWHGSVGEKGWMSVRAALTALARNNSMSALLRDCVAFTGDVDTVAAIAVGAGSRSVHVNQDLPEILHVDLENGVYGRSYLRELDARLLATHSCH